MYMTILCAHSPMSKEWGKIYIYKKNTLKLNVEANYPTCLLASMLSGTHLCVSFAKTIVEC